MKIIFAGSAAFALPHLKALIEFCRISPLYELVAIYTQPDRPSGRGKSNCQTVIKTFAKPHNFIIQQPVNFKSQLEKKRLHSFQADLMIVVAYGLILPQAVLNILPLGCINVHASLLPKWPGAAPVQHALLNGDKQTGITVIQIDAGLDTGDILYQESLTILPTDTTDSLQQRLGTMGAICLIKTLMHLSDFQKQARAQPIRRNTNYAAKITKSCAHINWHHDAFTIERQIRAFYSWPIATTKIEGKRIRVWKAALCLRTDIENDIPGKIVMITKQSIIVATKKGHIELIQLQLEGKKPLFVSQLISGQLSFLTVGMQFISLDM